MSKIVLVNPNKKEHAELILGMLDGKRVSPDKISVSEQARLTEVYGSLFKEDKVGKEDRLEYVYVKLGGLVRTEAEQTAGRADSAGTEALREHHSRREERCSAKPVEGRRRRRRQSRRNGNSGVTHGTIYSSKR